jgi:hypothetical protein
MTTSFKTLIVASSVVLCGRVLQAEMPALPPPGVETAEIAIPKAIIRAYESQVHPAYLRWLVNGDGIADSLAAFELFLAMQPVNRHEAWCYMVLYTRSH